jgi:hypothetical protein
MEYTKQQIEEFKSKSEKWDTLGDKIADCYMVKNPEYDVENNDEVDEYIENEDDNIDLGTIGEIAASAYGWL